jgi:hypothetical protein
MKNFIFGVIFGSAMSSVGFTSIAPMLDNGMRTIQQTTIDMVQKQQVESAPKLPPTQYQ